MFGLSELGVSHYECNEKEMLDSLFSPEGTELCQRQDRRSQSGQHRGRREHDPEDDGRRYVPIESVTAYPKDYTEATEVAKNELRAKARPKLTRQAENMAVYNVIFLGYPNWWGTMPMLVFTFLESYDFSGKTIVPFCTHEGSGMGHSEKDIAKACPKATVLKGIAIHGTNASSAGSDVSYWIDWLSIS
jgi:flavodoxin